MTTPHDPMSSGSHYPPDEFSPLGSGDPSGMPPATPPVTSTAGSGSSGSSGGGTTEAAKDQAQQMTGSAAESTQQVMGTAKEQAGYVTDDVRQQAQKLADETRTEMSSQAGAQRDRAVSGLRTLGSDLDTMASCAEHQGTGTQLAQQGAQLTQQLADYLEQREPAQLLDEVRGLARRRPGAFLLGSALAGMAVGRLTRGAVSARQDDSTMPQSTGQDTYQPQAVTRPTPGAYYGGAQGDPLTGGTAVPGHMTGTAPDPTLSGPVGAPPILDEPYGEDRPPSGYSPGTGGPA